MTKTTEEWARTAPAGAELDRVVAEWMGCRKREDGFWFGPGNAVSFRVNGSPPRFSTDWSAAGPLLEAMSVSRSYRGMIMDILAKLMRGRLGRRGAFQDVTPIDISRTVAVLVARGITRADLEEA